MTPVPQMMLEVAAELERTGALPGQDFWVEPMPVGMLSSEFYGLRASEDGVFEVYYQDMGEERVLESTSDAARAREVFVQRVLALAGPRGSGPLAVDPKPLIPLRFRRSDTGGAGG